jgi:hypothetical protein
MSAPKAGPSNLAVLAIVEASGKRGVSTGEIVAKTGLTQARVENYLKGQRTSRKISPILPPGSRNQRYVSASHFAAMMAAAGTFRKLPERSTSVTIIRKTGARNFTLSPERVAIESVLSSAVEPITVETISLVADVDIRKTRAILSRLHHDGMAKTTGGRLALWESTGTIVQTVREKRVCNGNQPDMPRGFLSSMNPVRPGAEDHLKYQSRGF